MTYRIHNFSQRLSLFAISNCNIHSRGETDRTDKYECQSRTQFKIKECLTLVYMYSKARARDYKHIHHILNESDGITLCDSLKTESSQSKLKDGAVNNEPFHKNWKLYKATWLLLRVTRANDKTGIKRHCMASIPVRVKCSLLTQARRGGRGGGVVKFHSFLPRHYTGMSDLIT
jgi:hypothetical protein